MLCLPRSAGHQSLGVPTPVERIVLQRWPQKRMTLTHQELFMYIHAMVGSSTSQLQVSQVFHALSDPTRLELIERLAGGEHCVCDLTDALKAGQSRLSFHLKVLKDAGLIRDRREGRWMYYALNEEAFEEVEAMVRQLKTGGSMTKAANRRC